MERQPTTDRMIQEYVPGKQVTLAHLIANPGKDLFKKLGLQDAVSAIGILTITPSEASIIACDIATKSGAVEIGFLDRFTGAVVLTGDVSAVEYALKQVTRTLGECSSPLARSPGRKVMKRLMFIGPSQCGKTSLTQSLRGEALHYKKTQAIEWSPMAIDTPGEYLENRCLYSALLTSACEADVIALVLNADAQWSPFSPGFTAPMNRPTIGLVTKADLAEPQRISLVAEWLTQAGARQIFITSALNNSGLDAVLDFLNSKEPLCLTK